MNYRREIDGLRAVAVLPVIFFHAGIASFSGGFVGVDIFFVISGYLITSIIVSGMDAGTFSLAKFYERRARRILPALYLVMLAAVPFAWAWLLPADIRRFSQSLIAVTAFASNILFLRESGYFDVAAELKPLLHTWSLAVEEQYYIIFPLLMLLMRKYAKRWVIPGLAVISIVSLSFAQWGAYTKPASTFFLLQTRSWELAIGALISFCPTPQGRTINQLASLWGLSLILISIFLFDSATPFPSIYALAPTLGAAIVILHGTPKTIVGRLLGSKAFVGIGLVSYSAYLWHQPLFALARHRSLGTLTGFQCLLLILLTFGFAFASWKYIERPFRTGQIRTKSAITLLSICGSTIIVIGLLGNFRTPDSAAIDWVDGGKAPVNFSGIFVDGVGCSSRDPKLVCRIGDRGSDLRIVIAGDSHARVLTEAALQLSSRYRFELIDFSESGCPFLVGMSAYVKGVMSSRCDAKLQEERLAALKALPPSVVILHSRFPLYISGKGFDNTLGGVEEHDEYYMAYGPNGSLETRYRAYEESFRNTVKSLLDMGHGVVIISGVPTNGWDPIERLYRIQKAGVGRTHEERKSLMKIPFAAVLNEHRLADKVIANIATSFPQVLVYDPKALFCDQDACLSISEHKILYTDRDHLSYDGSMMLFEDLLKRMGIKEQPSEGKPMH